MKIAIVSMIRDSWGGSEELWYNMAKIALSKGHEVVHLSYEYRQEHFKMTELKSLGLISRQRPGITGNVSGIERFLMLSTNFIRKKIEKPVKKIFEKNPDIMIYNGTCYSIVYEKEFLRELKTYKGKLFLLCHFNERTSPLEKLEQTILQEVYEKCTKIFFTNHHDIEAVKKNLAMDLPNAIVVRNPVNLKDTTMIPTQHNESIQIAMVGNLIVAHKGQDIAFNVLTKEIWKMRSWHLNVYGSGPDEEYLKWLCAKNDLKDRISFHGKVENIRAVWQRNHLLLMPSRMEGVPLAMVEAMLWRRPCVVTNVGGIPEWIEEGKSGHIADLPSEDSFENAMEKTWQHPDDWGKMGEYGHQRAIELCDPQPGATLLELIMN